MLEKDRHAIANRPWLSQAVEPAWANARTKAINYYSRNISCMAATTIQLDRERKARLSRLKVGAMTYDDVVGHLLEGIDEEEFRRQALAWQDDLARRIRSDARNRPVL
ncbi:MAG: hypothetical protein ACYC2H_06130 [Thermoplasmatota archaeon]